MITVSTGIFLGETTVGVWTVMLTPTMFGGPYFIKAYSKVKGIVSTITLSDVMFGDVWMCSGQSNMEFTVVMVKQTNYLFHGRMPSASGQVLL